MYARPERLEEALSLLSGREWSLLAGGTDFYPGLGEDSVRGDVLDIGRIPELSGITRLPDGTVRIGANVTWSEICAADLPESFTALCQAGREIGSVQIQNRATIVGNLCNASPAADGVPALLVLDGEIELASTGGSRQIPIEDFIRGNRQTLRRTDELVTAIQIPPDAVRGRSEFIKLGARRYLVISIVMVAGRLDVMPDGLVAACAIAVGSCSPVALRLRSLEAALVGQHVTDAPSLVVADHFHALTPIDDGRATAAYRHHAALETVRRVVGLLGHAVEPVASSQ